MQSFQDRNDELYRLRLNEKYYMNFDVEEDLIALRDIRELFINEYAKEAGL
jgi:hypothetical protein